MVGIIQEQHAERCRLFMQWKKMDWPIMVDSFGLLDVSAVPITLGIDEHGVVHKLPRRPDAKQLTREFLNKAFPKPGKAGSARKTRGIRAADALLQKKEMPAASVLIRRYSKVVKADSSNDRARE